MAERYAAQNVAFGMGGGLLQKVHRDTMAFATKLCKIVDSAGLEKDVMKCPVTDAAKCSLPGELQVILDADGVRDTRRAGALKLTRIRRCPW